MKRYQVFSLHCCLLDRECRMLGAPWRINMWLLGTYVSLALRPRDRFVSKVGKAHWLEWRGGLR